MNFNFGQLRKNQFNKKDTPPLYSSPVSLSPAVCDFEIIKGKTIRINSLNKEFKKNTMYALRLNCSLTDMNGGELGKDDFAECEIFLSAIGTDRVDNNKKMVIKILPIITGESQQITVLFSPKIDGFTNICFYLKNKSNNDSVSDLVSIENASLCTLNNVIDGVIREQVSRKENPGDGVKVTIVLKKIGLQGATGLPFMINGEEFKIGKSEIFTSDDIVISSLGIFAVESNSSNNDINPYYEDKNFFVLDYEYEEIGGSE